MISKIIKKVIISCYPRSGTNLLKSLMAQHGYRLLSEHNPELINNAEIITIAKNPIDTITSYFAMIKFYNQEIDEVTINVLINNYINTYKILQDKADFIINYNQLVSDPKPIFVELFKYLGLKYMPINYSFNQIKDTQSEQHLATSKQTTNYEEIMNKVKDNYLINQAYEEYNKLLALTNIRNHSTILLKEKLRNKLDYENLTPEQQEIWDAAYDRGWDDGWEAYNNEYDSEGYKEGHADGLRQEQERIQYVLNMMFESALNMGQGNKAVQYRNMMDLLRPVEIKPDNGDDF